ncbi:MAG: hypothetical protein J6X18_10705, partial [Bacteroidales bacterium]|nr:hypothetical protein [Bacteroidales bacterium]
IRLSENRILEAIHDVLNDKSIEEYNPEWYIEFEKPKYSRKPEETPDFNDNIYDFNTGRYAMLSQSDDEFDKTIGQSKRGTRRETEKSVEDYMDRIIREAIDRVLDNDTEDEDSGTWDTGLDNEERYRVKWCIKRYDYMEDGYVTVSEESVYCTSEQEARNLFKEVSEKYKGCYALYITIEKEIDTLTGKRWEYVLHMDGKTL